MFNSCKGIKKSFVVSTELRIIGESLARSSIVRNRYLNFEQEEMEEEWEEARQGYMK